MHCSSLLNCCLIWGHTQSAGTTSEYHCLDLGDYSFPDGKKDHKIESGNLETHHATTFLSVDCECVYLKRSRM